VNRDTLLAVSPIDGRYVTGVEILSNYFSEFALIRYRVRVEIAYIFHLAEFLTFPGAEKILASRTSIQALADGFTVEHAARVKEIERVTQHDVKAVEYFLKDSFRDLGLGDYAEWIHFGLTSQDINNTALPLALRDYLQGEYRPRMDKLLVSLKTLEEDWFTVPMLARTHGQPASPTTLGKEIGVFCARLRNQLENLYRLPYPGKFGGATGNFNAHFAAFPEKDWHNFADHFLSDMHLNRSRPTTQIDHYDGLAALFHNLIRINTILIDFSRDLWTYISMDYFRQKIQPEEIGSSAMPHKVNPIDFENAEGNLGIANALFHHFAEKLPISRLQRDLTDSTVSRNFGVPLAHTLIATEALEKGLSKLVLQREKLVKDLEGNWMVLAEAVQTILRREGHAGAYELLKDFTRGLESPNQEKWYAFLRTLPISASALEELLTITPFTYIGKPQSS